MHLWRNEGDWQCEVTSARNLLHNHHNHNGEQPKPTPPLTTRTQKNLKHMQWSNVCTLQLSWAGKLGVTNPISADAKVIMQRRSKLQGVGCVLPETRRHLKSPPAWLQTLKTPSFTPFFCRKSSLSLFFRPPSGIMTSSTRCFTISFQLGLFVASSCFALPLQICISDL